MQVLDVVQLKIKHRHQNEFVFIQALCVPVICMSFKMQEIYSAQEGHEHLSKLELGDFDDVSSELQVGLLIGVDYYFCFFTNKVIKKSYGPVACKTILGWELSGPLSSRHCFSSCLTTKSMRCMVEQTLDENDNLKQKHSRFLEIENVNPFHECVKARIRREIFLSDYFMKHSLMHISLHLI